MAKVIMICGKICSGKTTYAEKLRVRHQRVILSVDEIMLALFGQTAGDKHDDYAERTKKYLLGKSLKLLRAGIDVILDWGFWTWDERSRAKEFYGSRNIAYEFHYLAISDETWRMRLNKRNRETAAGAVNAYYVDDRLAAKFNSIFEPPSKEEIDVWMEE